MRKRTAIFLFVILLAANAVTGCSLQNGTASDKTAENDGREAQQDTFLEEAVYDFSYEKPKQTPNILINRNGYGQEAVKTAFFCGKELAEDFAIVDKQSGDVVFTGKMEDTKFSSELNAYIAKGDFSRLTTKGVYYIQSEMIGRSYSFEIGDNVYETIYNNIIESFYYHRCGTDLDGEIQLNNHKACHIGSTSLENTEKVIDTLGGWHTDNSFNKDVVESTKMVSDLLLTYEFLYSAPATGSEMTDEMRSMHALLREVSYEVNFLLKMQDVSTGAFYTRVESKEAVAEGAPDTDMRTFYVTQVSDEATAECLAVLTQFSRMYRAVDEKLADACLKAAVKAYTYLEKDAGLKDYTYYAACELYKTTGNLKYSQYILKYRKSEERGRSSRFDRELYGDIAYLTTTYNVDLNLCTELMDEMMNRAERIAASAGQDTYLVAMQNGKRDSESILESVFILTIVDHIVTSHEYVGIIENQLDYLFGRNELGVNMVTNKGILRSIKEEETYDLYLQSTLVFILHELIEREAE